MYGISITGRSIFPSGFSNNLNIDTMDDLLALMDGSPCANENEVNQHPSIDESDDEDIEATSGMIQTSRHSHHSKPKSAPFKSPPPSVSSACIDPLTRIRIVQRQTSKVDLVDLLAPFHFHTSAILANMPKTQLSTLITHPSNNNNNKDNDVSGRTDMATMGIIFTNSGTRISKNGRAFSILTLGDLHTGPTVSIFLFGHAYSNFTTKINPGSVVAVVGGSIMPSKGNQGGATRISLSVNDLHQIVLVGKAMDYGTCAATTVDKRNDTNNTGPNQVKCKKWVDLRIGRFCEFHAKQQNQHQRGSSSFGIGNGRAGDSVNKNMTFMQGLKADRDVRAKSRAALNHSVSRFGGNNNIPSNAMTVVIPGQGTVMAHNPNSNTSNLQRGGLGVSNALSHALASNPRVGMQGVDAPAPNQTRWLQRAPKHMSISNGQIATPLQHQRVDSFKNKFQNPYAKRSATVVNTSSSNPSKSSSSSSDILGQALLGSSTSRKSRKPNSSHTPLTKGKESKVRKRNLVHMEGMNGSVQVPKPNALFRKSTPHPYKLMPSTYATAEPVTPSPQQKSLLLENQRLVAERFKNKCLNGSSTNHSSTAKTQPGMKPAKPTISTPKSDLDDILGSTPLSDSNRSSILEAKSKYSQQAKAESYAQSRHKVSELEKQEAAYDKKQLRKESKSTSGAMRLTGNSGNGKRNSIGSAIIISEYKCVTCNKITQSKPVQCIRSNHKVKRKRDIKKHESTVQKRMNIKNRSVDDGGLVLGAGLEWSAWKGNI